jgi:hypothetical protein
MRKGVTLISLLVAGLAAPAAAQDAVQFMAGAWECRLPEDANSKTPPILYIGVAREKSGTTRTDIVEVDGFSRAVFGMAKVGPGDGGWVQLSPEMGEPILVRALNQGTGALPAMSVKRSASSAVYHCLRLPYPKA